MERNKEDQNREEHTGSPMGTWLGRSGAEGGCTGIFAVHLQKAVVPFLCIIGSLGEPNRLGSNLKKLKSNPGNLTEAFTICQVRSKGGLQFY